MRKVRIDSVADAQALPEGEWVEVPDGMKWLVPEKYRRGRDESVTIPLPRAAKRALNARAGEVLEARVSGESIVISRKRTKRVRRTA